jgi:hypothetical protein|tara:strand:- start:207 stop:416 length:210 start_codon:yes stop_codon:yes gene_type:complete
MAKLKLNRIKRLICSTCKGNGYLKVGTEWGQTVHQCWDCDSEGEFYETVESDTLIGDTDGDDNYSNKLH